MRGSPGRTVALWLVGVALLQAAWIVTVPPFRGSDEFAHVYRAASVAEGQVFSDGNSTDGRGLLIAVPADVVEAAGPQCRALPYTAASNCVGIPVGDGMVRVASGAGNYNPAFYAVIGTAARPFTGVAADYVMRVATALLSLLLLGLATYAATRSGRRWPLAALTVGATPVLVYSTTIPAPNGPEMASALAVWAALLALVTAGDTPDPRRDRRLLVIAVVGAVTLCTLRLLGPLFLLLIVITVVATHPRGARQVVRRYPRTVAVCVAVTALAGVAALAWIRAADVTAPPPGPKAAGDVDLAQFLVWTLQTIAAFPLRDEPGALVVYPIYLVLAGGLLVLALRATRGTRRAALVGAVAVMLLIPLVLTLATMSSQGVIWQGRYGLPYGAGVMVLAGFVLGAAGVRGPGPRMLVPALGAIVVGVAGCLLKIREREILEATDPAWWAPPMLLLVLLQAAAAAAWGLALAPPQPVTRDRDRPEVGV